MEVENIDELADGGPPSGVEMRTLGEMRFWLQPRADYLYVRWAGQVEDLDTANAWLAEISNALRANALFRILWEARPARVHGPEVRERLWEWMGQAEIVKVSSVVVNSELLRVSVNLSRVASGVRLRAFETVEDAETWLKRQRR